MTPRESDGQRAAADAVGRALGRRLRLYESEPGGDDTLDYIDELNEAYEMKLVTSQEFVELRKRQQLWFPSQKLSMHWSVLLEAPTMRDKFREMPEYPEDDPANIAAIEASGEFIVKRKTEREAEWAERFSGKALLLPRTTKREAQALGKHLLVLEQGSILNTRGAEPAEHEQRVALWAVRHLTHGAICVAHEPFSEGPGIEIRVGWASVRTGNPDTLAFRIQAWLDSPLGANLWQSLRQTGFARRHAVLSFDASEPEYSSAQEAGLGFVPTLGLGLPTEVDVLWCLVGAVLLRYDPEHGWDTRTRLPLASTSRRNASRADPMAVARSSTCTGCKRSSKTGALGLRVVIVENGSVRFSVGGLMRSLQ